MSDTILIVEDEPIIRGALRKLLEHQGYQIEDVDSVNAALPVIRSLQPDLIISDIRLPGEEGSAFLEMNLGIPILLMTSYASLRSAVKAMKSGAVDYIAKPFDHDEMLSAVADILDREARSPQQALRNAQSPAASSSPPGEKTITGASDLVRGIMYGECEQMQKLFRLIEKVAPTDSTVLIQGESGTGKELAARALHQASRRAKGELVCVNCAAIPETLIESELFGHERGAFTGAVSTRNGLIEAADQGTLFLDEIGELPLEAQARLLRVLQEGEIRRVGSTQSRKVDVRLIAATHRNLRSMAFAGEFREDLFYRLNVMPLKIPPLRERGADLQGLANKLLQRTSEQIGKSGLKFNKASEELIQKYKWPGNVRELENSIERAVILVDGNEITPDLLGIDIEYPATDQPGSEQSSNQPADLSLEDYFQHFVMENQGLMSETELARKLGISRKSLWERRQRLGIPRPKRGSR